MSLQRNLLNRPSLVRFWRENLRRIFHYEINPAVSTLLDFQMHCNPHPESKGQHLRSTYILRKSIVSFDMLLPPASLRSLRSGFNYVPSGQLTNMSVKSGLPRKICLICIRIKVQTCFLALLQVINFYGNRMATRKHISNIYVRMARASFLQRHWLKQLGPGWNNFAFVTDICKHTPHQ